MARGSGGSRWTFASGVTRNCAPSRVAAATSPAPDSAVRLACDCCDLGRGSTPDGGPWHGSPPPVLADRLWGDGDVSMAKALLICLTAGLVLAVPTRRHPRGPRAAEPAVVNAPGCSLAPFAAQPPDRPGGRPGIGPVPRSPSSWRSRPMASSTISPRRLPELEQVRASSAGTGVVRPGRDVDLQYRARGGTALPAVFCCLG